MRQTIHRLAHLFLVILWIGSPLISYAAKSGKSVIPPAIASSLDRNQIPLDTISISVTELKQNKSGKYQAKTILDWRDNEAMNPASTMKLLTTLSGLEILGPHYRWRTNIYTDGVIRQGVLKGNLYLQGTGDPKLVPEELAKMMKDLPEVNQHSLAI